MVKDNHMIEGCREKRRINDLLAFLEGQKGTVQELEPNIVEDWKGHFQTCSDCREYSEWHDAAYRMIQKMAPDKFDEAILRPPCKGPSYVEMDMYLLRAQKPVPPKLVAKIEKHLKECPECQIWLNDCQDWYSGKLALHETANDPLSSLTLILSGRFQKVPCMDIVKNVVNRIGNLITIPQTLLQPAFSVSLGADFLRAFKPVDTAVRVPFHFIWACHSETHNYLLHISTEDNREMTINWTHDDSETVVVPSDVTDISWEQGQTYFWIAEALDDRKQSISSTGKMRFEIIDEECLQSLKKELSQEFPGETGNLRILAESLCLAGYNLYDEAVEELEHHGALENDLLAAAIIALYEVRISMTPTAIVKRQLRSSLAQWQAILKGLSQK
jgi:predicted anti-sigma-YlaC factor YlaD